MKNLVSKHYHCTDSLNERPLSPKYFETIHINGNIDLSHKINHVQNILDIKANISIFKTALCNNTIEFKSGNVLKVGNLLKLYLKPSLQIKYAGGTDCRSVFVENINFCKIIYISVPECIDLENIQTLYRKDKITYQVYIEDLQSTIINKHQIKFSLLAFANIIFV